MTGLKTIINGLKTWVSTRKIDEKQIPDSIARVKDIPQGGVQANLDQNDSTAPDYVKGRKFWSRIDTIKFLDNVSVETTQYNNYYMSDRQYDVTLNSESTYDVIIDGVTYNRTCSPHSSLGLYLGNAAIIGMGDDNGDSFFIAPIQSGKVGIAFNEPGTHVVSLITTEEVLEKIDEKYLPNVSWNSLIDRPFGYLIDIENNTIFNQTIEIAQGKYFYDLDTDSPFLARNTYSVEYNGVTYNNLQVQSYAISNNSTHWYIGDYNYYYRGYGGSNPPFCIKFFQKGDSPSIYIDRELTKSGPISLTLKIEEFSPIYAIVDEKYLPDNAMIGKKTPEGGEIFNLSGIGSPGADSVATGNYSHAEGESTTAAGAASHAEGFFAQAIGDYSHAEGYFAKAIGKYSHAEGNQSEATGNYSHAEGDRAKATGAYSHAEGHVSQATGDYSHAECFSSEATGAYSHAEGYDTTAAGAASHAEGYTTKATGDYSHAEGYRTIASSDKQHVQGKCNIEDANDKYAHIVGNGEYGSPSNAHTLDWEGNAWYQGSLRLGGTIILKDQINGYDYVVQMRNGNLVSYCALSSIEVTTLPTKTTYVDGEAIDTTGMTVVGICQDGTTKVIDGYICKADAVQNSIIVSFVECGVTYTTSFDVTIAPFDPAAWLIDFEYVDNGNGTYTIIGWKGTLNGVSSTEMIVPDNSKIIV